MNRAQVRNSGGKFSSVLFVSPITPSFTGNGLAMRAAYLIEALVALNATLRLFVIPLLERADMPWDLEVANLCRSHARAKPSAPSSWEELILQAGILFGRHHHLFLDPKRHRFTKQDLKCLGESPQDEMLFVFRLSTLAMLPTRWRRSRRLWLDLDELDSTARQREATIARLNGDEDGARALSQRATYFGRLEQRLLALPRQISVSSRLELSQLPPQRQSRAVVLPNVVRARFAPSAFPRASAAAFRLLFIGSFGHEPNVDAVAYFCREILPLLQKRAQQPVEFVVAGPDLRQSLAPFRHLARVKILGFVEELASLYEEANLVVVPLRAGAGTRIKILEAFSYRRCVVSSTIGAEGLDVTSGAELMLADSPADFAETCATLLEDPARANTIAEAGHDFHRRCNTPDALRRALDGCR